VQKYCQMTIKVDKLLKKTQLVAQSQNLN
jgi:hypothetical protein